MDNNNTFGLPPIDWHGPEIVEGYFWSGVPYAVSAAVTQDVPLFQQGAFPNAPWFQNLVFPLTANRRYRILAQKVEAPIGFTPGTGATVGTVQDYFAANSTFIWNVESKETTQYRVVDFTPNDNYVFGITQAIRQKQTDFGGLFNPLDLPAQGLVSVIFHPAPSLPVTSATASINAPGFGYTNDVGHYVRLNLWTLVARPTV